MKALLQAGADVNLRAPLGETAFHGPQWKLG